MAISSCTRILCTITMIRSWTKLLAMFLIWLQFMRVRLSSWVLRLINCCSRWSNNWRHSISPIIAAIYRRSWNRCSERQGLSISQVFFPFSKPWAILPTTYALWNPTNAQIYKTWPNYISTKWSNNVQISSTSASKFYQFSCSTTPAINSSTKIYTHP